MEDKQKQSTAVIERVTSSVLQSVLDQLKTARHLLEITAQSKVSKKEEERRQKEEKEEKRKKKEDRRT